MSVLPPVIAEELAATAAAAAEQAPAAPAAHPDEPKDETTKPSMGVYERTKKLLNHFLGTFESIAPGLEACVPESELRTRYDSLLDGLGEIYGGCETAGEKAQIRIAKLQWCVDNFDKNGSLQLFLTISNTDTLERGDVGTMVADPLRFQGALAAYLLHFATERMPPCGTMTRAVWALRGELSQLSEENKATLLDHAKAHRYAARPGVTDALLRLWDLLENPTQKRKREKEDHEDKPEAKRPREA
jgi:hypothetical protein